MVYGAFGLFGLLLYVSWFYCDLLSLFGLWV